MGTVRALICSAAVPRPRAALPAALPGRTMASAVAWSTLGWLSYGLHVAALGAGSAVRHRVAAARARPLAVVAVDET
jgi:hypothetical protein